MTVGGLNILPGERITRFVVPSARHFALTAPDQLGSTAHAGVGSANFQKPYQIKFRTADFGRTAGKTVCAISHLKHFNETSASLMEA
jgi:hypothetical protein